MSLLHRKSKEPDITPAAVTTAGFVNELRELAGHLNDIADGLAEVHGVEPADDRTDEQETANEHR